MTNEKNSPSHESGNLSEKQKNRLYKADILSKFLTAILVVIIGWMGNNYLQNKQKNDSNLKMYTQLLSNKEASENVLRKDMFVTIFDYFFKPKDDENTSKQMTLSRIREKRLNLELLSRNFHESLDMKPLFKDLLMEIIRPRWKLYKLLRKLEYCEKKDKSSPYDHDDVRSCIDEVKKSTNEKILAINENDYTANIEQVKRLLRRYDRELDQLIKAAKRVTRKQKEILEEVSGELRLTVDLTGSKSRDICTSYRPNDSLPKNGTCKKKHCKCENEDSKVVENDASYKVDGVKTEGQLWFIDSNGQKDKGSVRYFLMRVRYVYPKWKQVYVEILTCPVTAGEKMTEDKCSKMCRTHPKINNKAAFWLEYFDFPLVDNTYINSEQRYSVILDGFETDENGNDVKANITLLYYPSSYAGLKEKSFYDTQLMRTLLKSDFFNKEIGQEKTGKQTPPVVIGPKEEDQDEGQDKEASTTKG